MQLVIELVSIAGTPCSIQSLVVFLFGYSLHFSRLRVLIGTNENCGAHPRAPILPLKPSKLLRRRLCDAWEHLLTPRVVLDTLHALSPLLVIQAILDLVAEDTELALISFLLLLFFPNFFKLDQPLLFGVDHILKEVIRWPDQVLTNLHLFAFVMIVDRSLNSLAEASTSGLEIIRSMVKKALFRSVPLDSLIDDAFAANVRSERATS